MSAKKHYKENKFIIWFGKLTGWFPVMLMFGSKVFYENKAVQGRRLPQPSILMSNHMAFWDFPAYLLAFYWQDLRFLVGEVLYSHIPILGWVLDCMGCICVERSATDFSFLSESIRSLDNGRCIAIFPQGRLPVKGQVFPYKPGVVMIALHSDAPIIPVYNDGHYGFLKRTHIMIGEPIHIREYMENPSATEVSEEEMVRLTKILEDKTYALKDELEKRLAKK